MILRVRPTLFQSIVRINFAHNSVQCQNFSIYITVPQNGRRGTLRHKKRFFPHWKHQNPRIFSEKNYGKSLVPKNTLGDPSRSSILFIRKCRSLKHQVTQIVVFERNCRSGTDDSQALNNLMTSCISAKRAYLQTSNCFAILCFIS